MSADTKPAEDQVDDDVAASLTIAFTTDGGMRVRMNAVKPTHAWAGSRLLQRIGDDLFDAHRAQQMAEQEARARRLLVPTGPVAVK